MIYKIFELL